jgi:hypothetical protein
VWTVVSVWVCSREGSTSSTNEVYNSFSVAMLVLMRGSWGPVRPAIHKPIFAPLTPVIHDRTKS